MRLAFWRWGKAIAPQARSKSASFANPPSDLAAVGDLDFIAIGQALARKRNWIIVPTLIAAVLSVAAVNMITSRYKSEARILIDGRDNIFLRPNGERNDERNALDPEAVTSQVQLLLSRDLARDVIKKNKLAELPEFDPVLRGFSPIKSLLALVGIGRDPMSLTPEERVLDAYYDRFTAYAVDKSRVVVVEFQSRDPDLAAKVANSIADGYLVLQQGARRDQAKSASQWLAGEIESLRKKVAEAESRVEDFRSKSSLFIGTNNTTLSNQQMGEFNTQLNNARALKSDAESKARLIREMLQSGKPIEASEVLNSELIRRLTEQRVTLRAQLAEQSSTLLDGHPRIKELKAQLTDLDRQLRDEASKISRSLDNDARIASVRVDDLSVSLDQLKKQASSTNGQDVQLRALEREAKAQRDLLESYLAKYREANTRENIEAAPADGRIISRASVSNSPAYPKKLPIVLLATLTILMLSTGLIITGELLRMTAPRAMAALSSAPLAPLRSPAADAFTSTAANETSSEARVSMSISDAAPEFGEVERLAADLLGEGVAARKVTVLGTASNESMTLTALTIARLLARRVRVVVVDLSADSHTLSAVSADPNAPGLAELMRGEASFGQAITKDRLSRAHLVNSGRSGSDPTLLQSPRLGLVIDALLGVYDHVLLDAGSASDLPAELLTTQARAVLVPDASTPAEARQLMCDQLTAAGFSRVTMLSGPVLSSDAVDPGLRVAAA
ncbi:MAG TPA: exopolysaccharide transport family protein [Bradyrhizobium sp.]|nr:exopolysaccharide transport family protein [Bradyrhizobium sp.]